MIRFLARWTFRLLLLAVVVVIGLFLIRDDLAREVLRHRIARLTGLETRLAGVESHLGSGGLTLRGLEIVNSPEFGGAPLLVLPELHVELDTDALRRREWRLRSARIHATEIRVVRNQRGETNVMRLARRAQTEAAPADGILLEPPGFVFAGIDSLQLTLGTLHLLDLGEPARNRTIVLGITNEVVSPVRSMADLHPLVLRILLRELGNHLGNGLRFAPPTQEPAPAVPSQAPSPSPTPSRPLSPTPAVPQSR